MALTDFSVHSPSTVILDDRRDPNVSWANHEARAGKGRGGVDTVAAVGTPIYAWADGYVQNVYNDGSAGNVLRLKLKHNPGWILDYKHLSRFAIANGAEVKKGMLIGYTGNSGGVTEHLHLNLVDPNGVRQNPWLYVSDNNTAGGSKPQEILLMAAATAITLYTKASNVGQSFFFGPGFFYDLGNQDGVDGQEKINVLTKPDFGVERIYLSDRDYDVSRIVAKVGTD